MSNQCIHSGGPPPVPQAGPPQGWGTQTPAPLQSPSHWLCGGTSDFAFPAHFQAMVLKLIQGPRPEKHKQDRLEAGVWGWVWTGVAGGVCGHCSLSSSISEVVERHMIYEGAGARGVRGLREEGGL